MLAKSLGVSVHPVFVREDETTQEDGYPSVLSYLAEETNGVRFQAKHEVTVDQKAELQDREYARLLRVKVELA